MTDDTLPPLPEPALFEGIVLNKRGKCVGSDDGYIADQMHAYAAAAVAAERAENERLRHVIRQLELIVTRLESAERERKIGGKT